MRVIIAGGSGLIGRALAVALTATHHDVTILSRDPPRVTGLPDGVTVARWDGRTPEGWAPLVENADAIVNLAGESIGSRRWTHAERHNPSFRYLACLDRLLKTNKIVFKKGEVDTLTQAVRNVFLDMPIPPAMVEQVLRDTAPAS